MGEITQGLLVAFMFILILSMGIGNILVAASDIVDRRVPLRTHWLPLGWLVLLLLLHLNLFWNTLDIFIVEDWRFFGFLYVTAGPVVLFIASVIILPRPGSPKADDPRGHYFDVARVFFPLLALVAFWSLGAEYFLLGDYADSPLWSVASIAVLLVLALSRQAAVHAVCTILFAALLLGTYLPLGASGPA